MEPNGRAAKILVRNWHRWAQIHALLFLNKELRNSGKAPNPSGFPKFLMKK
jgi:hypothetical protein